MNIDTLPSVCGIYSIKYLNKQYVGASVDVNKRVYSHIRLLKRGVHTIEEMQKDFNENGGDNFSYEVLCVCEEDELRNKENDYLSNSKFELYNKTLFSYKSTKERKSVRKKSTSITINEEVLKDAETAAEIENRTLSNLSETAIKKYSEEVIKNNQQ